MRQEPIGTEVCLFVLNERDLIYRGVFTSRQDLSKKIMTYISKYNRDPKPVKWKYNDPTRRISGSTSTVTVN